MTTDKQYWRCTVNILNALGHTVQATLSISASDRDHAAAQIVYLRHTNWPNAQEVNIVEIVPLPPEANRLMNAQLRLFDPQENAINPG